MRVLLSKSHHRHTMWIAPIISNIGFDQFAIPTRILPEVQKHLFFFKLIINIRLQPCDCVHIFFPNNLLPSKFGTHFWFLLNQLLLSWLYKWGFSHSIMLLHLFIGFFSVKNNSSSTWIFSTIFISMTFLDSPCLFFFFFNLYYPLQSVFSLMNARSKILTVVVPSCRFLQSFACPC